MTPDHNQPPPPAPEYVRARKVLLDALDALGPQVGSAILVGAQAVYEHTGTVPSTGIAMTTDGDLALDADLLTPDPELAGAMQAAGFAPGSQPGSWVGEGGVKVDLMIAPHQSHHTRPDARGARVPPHDKKVARITPGLEPALTDNRPTTLTALDPTDTRTAQLRLAGPAALIVAKLIKIQERHQQAATGAGRSHRVKGKDAVDIYRLLLTTPTTDLVHGLGRHHADPQAQAVSTTAITYLAHQHTLGPDGTIARMLATELPDDLVLLAQYHALVDDLLEAIG